MTDPKHQPDHKDQSIPEPGPEPEPSFDAPTPPAPEVIDSPERSTEF